MSPEEFIKNHPHISNEARKYIKYPTAVELWGKLPEQGYYVIWPMLEAITRQPYALVYREYHGLEDPRKWDPQGKPDRLEIIKW